MSSCYLGCVLLVDSSSIGRRRFSGDVRVSKSSPLNFVVIFGGDLNRSREGESRLHLDPLHRAHNIANPRIHSINLSSDSAAWDAEFAE